MESFGGDSQVAVGLRLKAVRDSLGHTQQEMAGKIGSSFSAYRAYEAGERPMRSDHLSRIGELGFDLNWLLLENGTMRRGLSLPVGIREATAVPVGHSDACPGFCEVREPDGTISSRLDLVPDVLAPALEWISAGIAAAGGQVDWRWAAQQVIGRYEWDFFTWLKTRDRSQS